VTRLEDRLFRALLVGQASAFACLVYVTFVEAPARPKAGLLVERLVLCFYVPAAGAIYVCAAACLVASALYLKWPSHAGNAWAGASAECACAFGAISVLTRALWTKHAWGAYWVWADPRPIKFLLVALVFGAILVFRKFSGDGDSERKFAAALGIFGAINLPLIHRGVDLWLPVRPLGYATRLLSPDPKRDLLLGGVATALLLAMLLWSRVRLALSADRIAEVEQTAAGAGLLDS